MVYAENRINILVADRTEATRKDAIERLTGEGFRCFEAGNTAQTLIQMRSKRPEVVLLDAALPGVSGNSLLNKMADANPDAAVIVTMPFVDSRLITECIKNGARDFVMKPLDFDQLVQRVINAIEMKRGEIRVKERQTQLENEIQAQKRQIRGFFLDTVEALIHALEAKDKYTAGHSQRVADYSLFLGGELRLSQDDLDELCYGALLHDIGKIGVDQGVQNKPSQLSQSEYKLIMTHATIGPNIVSPVVSQAVKEMIVHHHDHFDGSGLGQTLVGEKIPLGARIIAVTDAFDAMTSDRPYRAAMSPTEAMAEIRRCAGSQFDPAMVRVFNKLLLGIKII